MNWLAHTLLSEPTIDFQLGNLLADVVRGENRVATSEDFKRGAACHKAIDAFTDAHPLVHQSRGRLPAQYRRFSGVLIDVFYDYLLANRWERYSTLSLQQFVQAFYAGAKTTTLPLPDDARVMLERIIKFDSLGSYREIGGVERALRRISAYLSQRWRRSFDLEASVPFMLEAESEIASDFERFFPELQSHAVAWVAAAEKH